MKKVGIITYHRAENFGAFLQCFALQKTIEELGYRVEVIDYRQSIIEATYLIFNSKRMVGMSLKNKMGYIYYTLKNIKLRLSSKKRYAACRKKYDVLSIDLYRTRGRFQHQQQPDYLGISENQRNRTAESPRRQQLAAYADISLSGTARGYIRYRMRRGAGVAGHQIQNGHYGDYLTHNRKRDVPQSTLFL